MKAKDLLGMKFGMLKVVEFKAEVKNRLFDGDELFVKGEKI